MEIPRALETARRYQQAGRLQEAEKIYRDVLHHEPDNAQVLNSLGVVYFRLDRGELAHEVLTRAIRLTPNAAGIQDNLSAVLWRLGRPQEAIATLRHALELDPGDATMWCRLGEFLYHTGDLDGAAEALRQSLQRRQDGGVYDRLAVILTAQSRFDEAQLAARRAVELQPLNSDAHHNLATLLQLMKQDDAAAAAFRKAIELSPDDAMAHSGLGTVLAAQKDYSGALECFHKAIALEPKNPLAHHNLGLALLHCGLIDQAIAHLRRASEIEPDFKESIDSLPMALHYSDAIAPEAIFQEHLHWGERYADPLAADLLPHVNDRDPDRRLRVGYVSADFRWHSVAFFIEPVLAVHHRDQVEVFCYSNVAEADDRTAHLITLADHWRDVRGKSDSELAEMIRADAIDILIDLGGHTTDSRVLVFARRPAPVQVTYLGYPNTTGIRQIDYRLTDAIADPPDKTEHLYTEQLVRLGGSAWCYCPPDDAPAVSSPAALGNGYITFGSFNNVTKLSDHTLALWSRLILEVPLARLLLKGIRMPEPTRLRLLSLFCQHGIAEDRVEFLSPTSSIAEHLGLYERVDIALDAFPYNGTTTTCEALWMGVPVVTLSGATHVSRVGASLLTAVGFPQWIASSDDQFVQIASKLARDPSRLADIRRSLRDTMHQSSLMDSERFTRGLEEVYRAFWRRWCKNGGAVVANPSAPAE